MESPRAGAHSRHRQGSRSRAAAGAASAGGRHVGGHHERPGARPRRREGARTVPARENGGNHDIKNFTRGSRVFYPVHVAGGKLSGDDLHFPRATARSRSAARSRWAATSTSGVDLIKGGMNTYGITANPMLIPGRIEPRYSEFLTFIGVSVDETTGENYYLDASIDYRRACLNAIE
jgi:formamidase